MPDNATSAAQSNVPGRRKLSSAEIEAANRAEATALLIRAGYRVYRPEADVSGEDLVIRLPDGSLRAVQLKGRPTVEWIRYGGRNILMLFPDPGVLPPGRNWYLIDHDSFYCWVEQRHSHTAKWDQSWSYPSLGRLLANFLEPHSHRRWSNVAPPNCPPSTTA